MEGAVEESEARSHLILLVPQPPSKIAGEGNMAYPLTRRPSLAVVSYKWEDKEAKLYAHNLDFILENVPIRYPGNFKVLQKPRRGVHSLRKVPGPIFHCLLAKHFISDIVEGFDDITVVVLVHRVTEHGGREGFMEVKLNCHLFDELVPHSFDNIQQTNLVRELHLEGRLEGIELKIALGKFVGEEQCVIVEPSERKVEVGDKLKVAPDLIDCVEHRAVAYSQLKPHLGD